MFPFVKNFFRFSQNFFLDPLELCGVSLERLANIPPETWIVNNFFHVF